MAAAVAALFICHHHGGPGRAYDSAADGASWLHSGLLATEDAQPALNLLQKKIDLAPPSSSSPCASGDDCQDGPSPQDGQLKVATDVHPSSVELHSVSGVSGCPCQEGRSDHPDQSSDILPCDCEEPKTAVVEAAEGIAISLLQELRDEPLFGRAAQLYTDYTFNRSHGTTFADVAMVIFLVLAVVANVFMVVACWILARAGDKPPGSSTRTLVKAVERQQKLDLRSNWLAATVIYGLQELDKAKTGIDMSISSVSIDKDQGSVELLDVAVINPGDYKMPCCVRIKKVRLILDMEKLVASSGADVSITKVTLDDVAIVVEQAGGSTNVADLMTTITAFEPPEHAAWDLTKTGEDDKKECADASICSRLRGDLASQVEPTGPPEVSVRRVEAKNIHAKAGWLILAAVASEMQIPGITYVDFEREVASSWRAEKLSVGSIVVPFFIMLLVRTVAAAMSLDAQSVAGTLFDVPLKMHTGEHEAEQAEEDSSVETLKPGAAKDVAQEKVAQKAAAEKAAAEKAAAEKAAAEKAAAEKAAAEKAAAEKAVAEKEAAEKAAAEKEAAEKAAAEKAAAEKEAAEKAAAEKAAAEKEAAEKAAAEKAAADKAAAEKAAAERAAVEKAAMEKAATDKVVAQKAATNTLAVKEEKEQPPKAAEDESGDSKVVATKGDEATAAQVTESRATSAA